MKKLLFAGFALLVIVIYATANDRTKQFTDQAFVLNVKDTIPKDTTKKDTMQFYLLSRNVNDTLPKDTTKKDTTIFASMAYAVQDTIPKDTTRKDTTFESLALVMNK